MRIAELLTAIASWLENPDNEVIKLAEYDIDCLAVVGLSCVEAATSLRKAAAEVELIEPPVESTITPESIEEIANLAAALDASGDPALKKQASVLDELLLSIAAPPNAYAERKDLQEQRLVALKDKYEKPRETLHATSKLGDQEKKIEQSGYTKPFKIESQPLSTRYCPQHAGVSTIRVGEHLVQCPLDHKTYDYEIGYTLDNGDKVPGGDVSLQTQNLNPANTAIFDDRAGRLATNRG